MTSFRKVLCLIPQRHQMKGHIIVMQQMLTELIKKKPEHVLSCEGMFLIRLTVKLSGKYNRL